MDEVREMGRGILATWKTHSDYFIDSFTSTFARDRENQMRDDATQNTPLY